MATIITPPPIFPVMPAAKFRIGDHEPLTWLVSILFTQEFWQRDNLTKVPIDWYKFAEPASGVKPKYESWPALYEDAENWVRNNEKAAACLALAKKAIERGELSYHLPKADKWGERPYHVPERDIDSYEFLLWAERNGYAISKDVINASQIAIHLAQTRAGNKEQQEYAYPPITSGDFAKLRKEPLWELGTGILYLMGRRSRAANKEPGYKSNDNLFGKIFDYALDAFQAGQLRIIKTAEEKPSLKLVPGELIAWAQTLPIILPMLETISLPAVRPSYCTSDMALMYDAVEKFWNEYDLENPNPNVAPMKKDVVAWLVAEAKSRGIQGFSKTRAEIMDTIMRCPAARKGGNTL